MHQLHAFIVLQFKLFFSFAKKISLNLGKIESLVLVILIPMPIQANTSRVVIGPVPKQEDRIKLQSMSLKEKVGQLFIFGFSGKKISRRLEKKIQMLHPGALVAFKRNIKTPYQISKLNLSAQKLSLKHSGTPLLIMVDQEGGNVARINTKPRTPSALAIGATGKTTIAYDMGHLTGTMLRLLGFNQNLAPVADLSDPYKKNFIGNRSFGKHSTKVKAMVSATSKGMLDAGILPTAKHFPGHGGISQDSHKTLPQKFQTLDDLLDTDLIPFKHMYKHMPTSATMVAHVAFPNIDHSGDPATFSKILVTDILRNNLFYKGLIITDDIEMVGAKSIGNVGKRAIRAIQAGNDMVMVAWSYKKQFAAHRAVVAAVQKNIIPMSRIDESVLRILAIKRQLDIRNQVKNLNPKQLKPKFLSLLQDLQNVTNRISRANYNNSMKDKLHLLDFIKDSDQIDIYSSDRSFYKAFRKKVGSKAKFIRLSRKQNNFKKKLPHHMGVLKNINIFYVSGIGTARILRKQSTKFKQNTLVVNTGHPGLISDRMNYRDVINVNTRNFQVGYWLGDFFNQATSINRVPARKKNGANNKNNILFRSRLNNTKKGNL